MSMAEKLKALTQNALVRTQNKEHEAAARRRANEERRERERLAFQRAQEDEAMQADAFVHGQR